MLESLSGRTAIITGASSGLGEELARQLARSGVKVGLLARREERLSALTAALRAGGAVAAYRVADVSARAETVAAIRALENELGPTDLLIANAGIGGEVAAKSYDATVASQLMAVNVGGVLNALEAVLPGMVERHSGQIVAVASIAAFMPMPRMGPYSASKVAVINLMESLRLELWGKGVDVTILSPGFVKTPMTHANPFPMPFLLDCTPAVERMVEAIAARQRHCIFPRRLYALTWLARVLPPALVARVIRTGMRGGGKRSAAAIR